MKHFFLIGVIFYTFVCIPKTHSMPRKSKTESNLFVVNVKLRSTNRSGDDAYIDVFEKLFHSKIPGRIYGDTHYIIRTQFKGTQNDVPYLYGKFSSFTKIEGQNWLNLEQMEPVVYEIPDNIFPNLKETSYYFIPSAHRFCIEPERGFSVKNVVKYLEYALPKIIESDEELNIEVETEINAIEEIIHANRILNLEIDISYTNDDLVDKEEEFADREFKEMQAGKAKIILTPDHHKSLSMDSKFLLGTLKLAQSNGKVKANIVDAHDIKRKIETSEYPRRVHFTFEDVDLKPQAVFNKIMQLFRQ